MLDLIRDLGKSAEEKRQERVSAYVDGALTPRQRQQFERELAQDAALQAEVTRVQQLKQNLRRLPRRPAPRNFTLDPALYGAPRPQPLVQLYPAMRVATAMTAVFFVIAIVADLLASGSLGAPRFAGSAADAPVAVQVESAADVESTRLVMETVAEEAVEEAAVEAAAELDAGATELAVEEDVTIEAAESEPAAGDTVDAPLTIEMTPALTMPQNGVETFEGETAAAGDGDVATVEPAPALVTATSPPPEAALVGSEEAAAETAAAPPAPPANFDALRFFQTGLGLLLLTLVLVLIYTRRQM